MDPQDYGFLVTLCICGIVLFAIIGLFCILRRAFKKFYEARQYFDSEDPSLQLPQGTFSWLVPFFKKFDFQEMLYTHGVDAYIYLRFVRTTLIVLIIIAFLGCAILFPINYVGKNKDADPSSDVYVDGLDILSMANVENGSHLLWAHVVFTFLVTIIVCAAFWWEYREYFRVRKMYKRRVIPSNFSVIVRGIPIAECNPETLMHFLDNVTPLRPLISEVEVYYLTPELDHLLELREKALQNLESAQEKTRRKGSDPGVCHGMFGLFGSQEPAVPFYTRQIATYENQIRNLQIRVPSPTQPPSGVAFITFSSQKAAQMVSQVILSRKYPRHWQVFPAPEPNDVNWNQLEEGLHTHTMRTALTNLLTFMVVFFWSIPVFFLAGLANLDTLSKIKGLRFLVDLLEKSDWLAGFIQGFLPNLVLIIFMATVSAIMHAITKLQGIYSKSLVDKSTLLKYHFFLICNVLLVYTIGGSIFSFLDRIIDSPKEIFSLLASSLPMQATQFTNYVLLTGFVWHLLELLRPHILIGSLIKKHLLCSSANQCKQAMNPGQFDYTEYYAKNLLIFTIAIVYSTMNPLILLPAVAYFGLGLFIHSYNIKYVYLTNYEGGGLIWPSIFRRLIAALIIFQLLMIGVFNLKRIPGATAIIVQVVLTLYFGQRCEQIFKKKAHFGVLDDETEPLLPDALRGAYLQPSLRRLEEEPAENLEEVTELPVEEKEKMGDDKVIVKLTFRPSDF